jgi:hypothetical protein
MKMKNDDEDESPSVSSMSENSLTERISTVQIDDAREGTRRRSDLVDAKIVSKSAPTAHPSSSSHYCSSSKAVPVHADAIKLRPVPINSKFVESLHGFEIPPSASGSRQGGSAPTSALYTISAQPSVIGLGQSSFANYYQHQQIRHNHSTARSRNGTSRSIFTPNKDESNNNSCSDDTSTLFSILCEINESPTQSTQS